MNFSLISLYELFTISIVHIFQCFHFMKVLLFSLNELFNKFSLFSLFELFTVFIFKLSTVVLVWSFFTYHCMNFHCFPSMNYLLFSLSVLFILPILHCKKINCFIEWTFHYFHFSQMCYFCSCVFLRWLLFCAIFGIFAHFCKIMRNFCVLMQQNVISSILLMHPRPTEIGFALEAV